MKVTHRTSAAVLAVMTACTWAVPAAVSHAVPAPQLTVGAHEQGALDSTAGTTVTFRAPEGWSTSPSTSRTSVTFTRAEQDQELTLSVVDGSQNFDTTADRVLRQQALDGTSAAFDGGSVSGGGGFTGKSCVAIKTEQKATGPCAVVHNGATVVLVTATSTSKDEAPDLQGLLDSLAASKEGAQ